MITIDDQIVARNCMATPAWRDEVVRQLHTVSHLSEEVESAATAWVTAFIAIVETREELAVDLLIAADFLEDHGFQDAAAFLRFGLI